jgi:hypothetical protein
MPVQMSIARLRRSGRDITARDYEKDQHGDVVCLHCDCEVVGVQGSVRVREDQVIPVNPFFRLKPESQANGTGHGSQCRHNKLLSCPEEMPVSPARGNRYVRCEKVLLPYLKSAQSINSPVAAVQDLPEIRDHIRLVYGPHEIVWDKYFFDMDGYCRLITPLLEGEEKHRKMPIALVVDIIAGQQPKQTSNGTWQIRAHSSPCITGDFDEFVVRPVLYVAKDELAQRIYSASTLLVCGQPRLAREIYYPNHPKMKPRIDLSLEVYSRSQICAYNSTRSDQGY